MQRTYSLNIYNLYIIKLAKWLMLIMPIVALFYNENGLTELDIFILQAVYSISVAILEIPSGYMADIVGRRTTLILGSILGTLGFAIYSLSYNMTGFLIAEIVLGLGGSFISGSDSALLFDSLVCLRKKHKYLQFEGRITSLGNFAETVAAICGGLLAAAISYRAVYVSQTFIAALAIPASLLLLEPAKTSTIARPGMRHILRTCKKALFVNRQLASTIFLSSIIGASTLCMAWTAQIYFVAQNFDEITITPLWVTLNLTVAIAAAFTANIIGAVGLRKAVLAIIICIPLCYVALGLFPVVPALCCLYIFYAIRGYATPVLKDLINHHCDASVRATILSIRSLIIRLSFALLGPAIGWMTQLKNLSYGLTVAGCTLLLCSTIAGLLLFKSGALEKMNSK